MQLSPEGIAMCQACGVETQAEGEGIHGRGYHHRHRSGKERIPTARGGVGRVGRVPKEAVATTVRPFRHQSRLNRKTFRTRPHAHNNNDLGGRERPIPVASPPPLALKKLFSRSDSGRIFPLFSRVMWMKLSTGPVAGWLESGLTGPIFSGPDDCASLVNCLQVYEIAIVFYLLAEHFDVSGVRRNGTQIERSPRLICRSAALCLVLSLTF